MTLTLTTALVIVAIATLLFVLHKIKKNKMLIDYSIFWIVFSFLLVILAIFPQIATWASIACGIESASNFVFAFMLLILILYQFNMAIHISEMESKNRELAQNIALKEKNNSRGNKCE